MNEAQKKEPYSGGRDLEIRAALDRHWAASDASDFEAEHLIYQEDAVLEYPQSGERTRGRRNIQNQRASQPSKKRFTIRRILGGGDLRLLDLDGGAGAVQLGLGLLQRLFGHEALLEQGLRAVEVLLDDPGVGLGLGQVRFGRSDGLVGGGRIGAARGPQAG